MDFTSTFTSCWFHVIQGRGYELIITASLRSRVDCLSQDHGFNYQFDPIIRSWASLLSVRSGAHRSGEQRLSALLHQRGLFRRRPDPGRSPSLGGPVSIPAAVLGRQLGGAAAHAEAQRGGCDALGRLPGGPRYGLNDWFGVSPVVDDRKIPSPYY